MHPLLIFGVSLFVGFVLGFFIAASLMVASEADEQAERLLEDMARKEVPR